MKQLLFPVVIAVAALSPPRPQSVGGSVVGLVFRGAEIIDTTGGAAQHDMTVIVRGDRIVQVGKDTRTRIPAGARVVDASGKFLIPGLWDMHFHTFFGRTADRSSAITVPLLVANGVTGVRDMGSDLDSIVRTRGEIEVHRLLGPRMVIAGPMLDGPQTKYIGAIAIATPSDGRRAVTMLKSRGVDFIKIQSGVPRDAYFAIVEECKKQELPFAGHVPDSIRAVEAVSAGQKSFEHLIGVFEGSSNAEEELLKGPKGPGRFLATYDPNKERALIQLLADRHVWQSPTLYWERGQWLVDAIDASVDPDSRYAPISWLKTLWPSWTTSIMNELDTDPLPVRRAFVEHELQIVRRLHLAGVPFLAGTDAPTGVGLVPGFSLHRELDRLVAAGFTPLEALQTATINPARFLGKLKDLGTIEKAKIADLVLLDADPTQDINNTRKIRAVVAAGQYLSRDDLDRILSTVETAASR